MTREEEILMPLFLTIIETIVIFIEWCISAFFAAVTFVFMFGLNLFLSLPQPIRYAIVVIGVFFLVRCVYRIIRHKIMVK